MFGILSLMQFKQLAVGLAVPVLLDATVVRGVLLPSVMVLLGEHSWYLPCWLSGLSRISGQRPPGPGAGRDIVPPGGGPEPARPVTPVGS